MYVCMYFIAQAVVNKIHTYILADNEIYKQCHEPNIVAECGFRAVSLTFQSLTIVCNRFQSETCQKATSDLGLGGSYHRVFKFPPPITSS